MGDIDSNLENVPKTQQAIYTGYDDSNLQEYVNYIFNQRVLASDANSS